jgi:hypothetical protein
MGKRVRIRFWIEAALAAISGILAVLTLVVHDWVEVIFGVEPDEGSGSFEVWVTVIAIALTVVFALVARIEWRRATAGGAA